MKNRFAPGRPILFSLGFLLAGVALAEPVATTPCELARNAERRNGQMVIVRGRIEIAFEHFALAAENCGELGTDGIWLEYGSGPKSQPTTWCCGDLTPRDPLKVVQNADFRKFHRDLTAQRRGSGCYGGQCYLHDVTATLTGRVDVSSEGGFGHFGLSCSRLVIQSASNVVAKPRRRNDVP